MTRLAPAWVQDYQRGWARSDVVAGLTVWAILIPESLAYATIAGLPPVVGLYAAIPSLLLYATLGSSRHLVVAPMSATAALSGSIAATYAGGDPDAFLRVSITLSLAVGLLGLLAGVLRLGFLSSFISEPVLKGFIIGLALTILIGQVPDLLGIEKPDGGFFATAWRLLLQVPDIDGTTALVGLGALATILLLRHLAPVVPSSLVVVVLGIAASGLLGLADRGVAVVGDIEAGLPSLGLPGSDWSQYLELLGPAAGVLLVGFVESLAAAKAYAVRDGYALDPGRELTALGAANVGSALVGGMVVNGSLSKTAVNGAAGARSQLSGVVAGVLTVLTLLLLTGLFEQLPEAVLAAVVIAAVVELVDIGALRHLYGIWSGPIGRIYRGAARADFIAALGALLGVLVLEVLPGLFLGITLSLVLLLYRASRPHVARLVPLRTEGTGGPAEEWVEADRHPDAEPDPRVAVVRVEGSLFFANADHVREQLLAAAGEGVGALVLDAVTIGSIDVSAAGMLEQVAHELERRGVLLLTAAGLVQVRDVLDTSGHGAVLHRQHADVPSAVAAARAELDRPG